MKTNLTNSNRNKLAHFLLDACVDGRFPKGKLKQAATSFDVCLRTVYYTWAKVMEQKAQGMPIYLSSKKVGLARKKLVKFDVEKMKSIEFHRRNTIRNLSSALGISKSTIGRWKIAGVIKAHTNAIKPFLTQENQIARLKYCVNALYFDAHLGIAMFKDMVYDVHVDEKWFYLSKCTQRYYLTPDEVEPHRTCQSKRFIKKVMFISGSSRPMYTSEGELVFDGKIGMWAFTKTELAKRNSRNRIAGTPETKALDSINKDVTKEMMINHVIPAIKAKWPRTASKNIRIQWDNARPHISNDDEDFRAAASADGFNIQLVFQPPNSPDTNINDLGWFRSIDSLKTDVQATTVDQMVAAVQESFDQLSHKTLNKIFLSLQACMIEMMKVRGQNNYRIPHLKNDSLDREGLLPNNLQVDPDLVRGSIMFLRELGHSNEHMEGLMNALDLVSLST